MRRRLQPLVVHGSCCSVKNCHSVPLADSSYGIGQRGATTADRTCQCGVQSMNAIIAILTTKLEFVKSALAAGNVPTPQKLAHFLTRFRCNRM